MEEQPLYDTANKSELINRYMYHPPVLDLNQDHRYESIRTKGREFALYLAGQCPPSRELSLAMTNLEQAVMWANAAIARHERQPELPAKQKDLP